MAQSGPLDNQPSPCSHHSCLKNSEAGCLELPVVFGGEDDVLLLA